MHLQAVGFPRSAADALDWPQQRDYGPAQPLMADVYQRNLPPPKEAIELPPEELALFVLRFLKDPEAVGYRNRYNFTLLSSTPYGSGERRTEVQMALAEAWSWLEREGLIVARPGQTTEWYAVSRRGHSLESEADFTAYTRGGMVRRQSLNPTLEQKVWPLFIRGDYDVAVLQAFKLVEVRVRELGNLTNEHYGVDLMRQAFKPNGGPLTDPTQPKAEQEATSALFAGAIGLFKNPGSHRLVDWKPDAAAEAIYLANTLLRMLDNRGDRTAS
jgi:uncharacterized protein (TIGR02391 family)